MMTHLRFTDLLPHDIDFAVFHVCSEIAPCNLGTHVPRLHAETRTEQHRTIGSLPSVGPKDGWHDGFEEFILKSRHPEPRRA